MLLWFRCGEWNPPEFRLDIQCLGDDHTFLLDLVTEIGVRQEALLSILYSKNVVKNIGNFIC